MGADWWSELGRMPQSATLRPQEKLGQAPGIDPGCLRAGGPQVGKPGSE